MNYLRQIHYFVTLSEHGNFARAAEALHITQPALSRSIQALESSLGCQLFNREARNVSLTAHGKTALDHALPLLVSSHALKTAVEQLSNLDSGELRFGAGPIHSELMAQVIISFAQQHPRVKQTFKVDDWNGLSGRLLRDDIEFFVSNTHDLIDDPRFEVCPLKKQRIVLLCRPEHPLATSHDVFLSQIHQYPIACTSISRGGLHSIDWLKRTNGEDLLSLECDNIGVLKSLIGASNSIGLSIHKVVAKELETGELVSLQVKGEGQHFCSYGLITRTGYKLSPAAEVMKRLIIEQDALFTEARLEKMLAAAN